MKRICLVFVAILLVTAAKAEAEPITENLIGYWKFDNAGTDLSGGGRDLDLYGGAAFDEGLFGQALDLRKSVAQYAQRPIDDDIYDFGPGDFTLQVWVNLNSLYPEQVLVEKFEGLSGPGWTLTYYPYPSDESKWHFYSGVYSPPGARIYSSDQDIAIDAWHHLVVRKSGNTYELFYNGDLIGSVSNSLPIPDTNYPLLFGKRNAADYRGFPLDGKLDEVAIWNRALTDDEIIMLYNEGRGYELPLISEPTTITIDIKPGSYPNSINLKSKGVVPVAILTTADFDASIVDPTTVEFAKAPPIKWTLEDVDYDGDFDLLLYFNTQELSLDADSIEATLTGMTDDEIEIVGTDSVNIVPKGKQ